MIGTRISEINTEEIERLEMDIHAIDLVIEVATQVLKNCPDVFCKLHKVAIDEAIKRHTAIDEIIQKNKRTDDEEG